MGEKKRSRSSYRFRFFPLAESDESSLIYYTGSSSSESSQEENDFTFHSIYIPPNCNWNLVFKYQKISPVMGIFTGEQISPDVEGMY